jgi:hypothetical protein
MGSCHHLEFNVEATQLAEKLNSSHYNLEAAATSMKHHLRRTQGSHTITTEELPHYLLRYRPV